MARPGFGQAGTALRAFGVPGEVLTDNGKQFNDRNGRGGEVLFDRICRDNGITHRLTQPRSPTTTGKIERFHGSLRRELLDDAVPFAGLAAAQAAAVTNPAWEPGRDKHEQYRERVLAALQASPWARVIKASDFTDNAVGIIHTTGPKLPELAQVRPAGPGPARAHPASAPR